MKKKKLPKLPKYTNGDRFDGTRPMDAEGTTANYFNTQRDKSKNIGQYAGYAQAAAGLGTQLAANNQLQGDQKNTANAQAVSGTVDQVLGSATPWYGLANTASGLVGSMVKRDAEGRPVDAGNQFIATTAKPMHKSLIEDVSKGDYGSAVGDLFGARNIASIGALFAPKNKRLRGMASGEESLFAMGGKYQYAEGGVNAEVEKQENSITPEGEFTQYNGPSHDQGGIKTHLDKGEMIFSDKLKFGKKTFAQHNKANNTNKEDKILESNKSSQLNKRTAELMKSAKLKASEDLFNKQEELKQSKVMNYAKRMGMNPELFANGGLKRSEDYGSKSKPYPTVNSNDFAGGNRSYPIPTKEDAIDALRLAGLHGRSDVRAKVFAKYPELKKESGGIQKYPWGGMTDDKGFPIDATGRRLTPEEQMGFNRPSYSYGQNAPNRLTTSNYGATKQFGLTDPAYNAIPTQVQLPKFVYNVGAGTSYEQQQQDYLTKNKLNLGTFETGGYAGTPDNPYKKFKGSIPAYENGGPERMESRRIENPYEIQPSFPNFNPALYGQGKYDPSNMELKGNPQIVNNTYSPTPRTNKEGINWGNVATQVGLGVAQNAGNLYDLLDRQKPEVTKYDRVKANLLNDQAALRDAEHEARLAALNIRDASGGNAGSYLSNRIALNAQNVINKDRIRQNYANANAEIANTMGLQNAQIQRLENDANEMNRAKARSIKQSAIGNMGSNIASQYKDIKMDKMDQKSLAALEAQYPGITKDPRLMKLWGNVSGNFKTK